METDAELQSHTNIKLSLGTPAEDKEKELWEPDRSRTSKENLQHQLMWAHRGFTETEPTTRDPAWD